MNKASANVTFADALFHHIDIDVWRKHFTYYNKTTFFDYHDVQIEAQFLINVQAMQTFYDNNGIDFIREMFEEEHIRHVRTLFSEALLHRDHRQIHVYEQRVQMKPRLNRLLSQLFKLAENMVREQVGEKRRLKIDEHVLSEALRDHIAHVHERTQL